MKSKILMALIFVISMILNGCGSSSSSPSQESTLQGTAQKGPFVSGSIVKIFKLDENYDRTSTFLETTTNGDGNYTFSTISWSGISEIEVSGRFLNENTGSTTQSAKVTSIVNVQDGQINRQNVNVLTHMASGQIKRLLKSGKTLDEANSEVVTDLFGILGRTGLGINDFGDLDLMDLTGSNATANQELLLISSALLNSNNYSADLELLLIAYKNGGIEGLLASPVYQRLMRSRQTLSTVTIAQNLNLINPIVIPKVVQINKGFRTDILNVTLFGTEFTTHSPTITVHTTNGDVTLGQMIFSDNNQSVSITISGAINTCLDNKMYITILHNNLTDTTEDLKSNTISTQPTRVVCSNRDENGNPVDTRPVTPLVNLAPVAIIGMLDDSVNGQQAPQKISTDVGALVYGLETYYSHDQENYPIGSITSCEWKDESNKVIKNSNNEECGIYDKIFTTAGIYVYTLTVKDNNNATNSNTVSITVHENAIPVLTLNPNTQQEILPKTLVEINATATDADVGDTLVYSWKYKKLGTNSEHLEGNSNNFSHTFIDVGTYLVTATVTDSHSATVSQSVKIIVADQSDALPVALLDTMDTTFNQEIYVGQRPYVMVGGTDDNGIISCRWQEPTGRAIFEKTITPPTTYLDYNECNYEFPIATTAGHYIYTFVVEDTANQIDTNEFNLTVLPNHVPTATIGSNRTIEAGTTLDITAVITHNDIDTDMTYQWLYGVKGSGTMSGAGNTVNFSHTFNDIGLYEVTFRVGDTHNTTSLVSIDVNVTKKSIPVTPKEVVTVGNLMWEDTEHSRVTKVANWSAAESYCSALTLDNFTNWRLATRDEIIPIMAGQYNDNTKSAIIEGFVVFYPNDLVSSWLSNPSGSTDHMVAWFDGGNLNIDGLTSTNNQQGVRCVRTK